MSISPSLRSVSRAAYRDVLRAANITFAGDAPVLQAFRMKVRNDLTQQDISGPELFEKQTQFIREVADILRKNIVQAQRLDNDSSESPVYRIRMTKFTELGDNESIKSPESMRAGAKRCQDVVLPEQSVKAESDHPADITSLQPQADVDTAHDDVGSEVDVESNPVHDPSYKHLPRSFSKLRELHKARTIPQLLENDLEERFVRGSGPGGQSINKTQNCVQLLHKPSGLRVSCQETRSLKDNRRIARKLIVEKLDKMMNPGLSKNEIQAARQRERERRKKKKGKKKKLAKMEKERQDELGTPDS